MSESPIFAPDPDGVDPAEVPKVRLQTGAESTSSQRPSSRASFYGSWVTSIRLMEELVERLVRWELHPEELVTDRFALSDVAGAYSLMADGRCGKVAVCFDEELQ